MRKLPVPIYNSESDILVRWPSGKPKYHCFVVARLFDLDIRRSLCTLDEIGIEYIELISLNDFGGRIIRTKESSVGSTIRRGKIAYS